MVDAFEGRFQQDLQQCLAAEPSADQQGAKQEIDGRWLDLDEFFILQPDGQPAKAHDQCRREDQHRADMAEFQLAEDQSHDGCDHEGDRAVDHCRDLAEGRCLGRLVKLVDAEENQQRAVIDEDVEPA